MNAKQLVGKQGEHLVKQHLEECGYKILHKNFRIAGSEIDIIALKDEILAFIEVKTRNTRHFSPSQLITAQKKKALIYGARYYRHLNGFVDCYIIRFDVCFVMLDKEPFELEYIENAFTEESEFF